MCVHPKTKAKLRKKLRELTSRSNGWGYEKRKEKLTYAIRGWVSKRLVELPLKEAGLTLQKLYQLVLIHDVKLRKISDIRNFLHHLFY